MADPYIKYNASVKALSAGRQSPWVGSGYMEYHFDGTLLLVYATAERPFKRECLCDAPIRPFSFMLAGFHKVLRYHGDGHSIRPGIEQTYTTAVCPIQRDESHSLLWGKDSAQWGVSDRQLFVLCYPTCSL